MLHHPIFHPDRKEVGSVGVYGLGFWGLFEAKDCTGLAIVPPLLELDVFLKSQRCNFLKSCCQASLGNSPGSLGVAWLEVRPSLLTQDESNNRIAQFQRSWSFFSLGCQVQPL